MALFNLPSFVTLFSLILGGGHDLGSFVAADSYWKSKGVAVSAEQLFHELEPVKAADVSGLIADLDADDPALRQAAAGKIFAFGPAAAPALAETVKSGSAEAAARAAKLLVEIRASNKPASVRRLMAIRMLGELKDRKALPVLRPLLESREMFEADYARRAIAAIEGTPYVPPVATEAERAADVALLPGRLDAIIQLAPTIDGAFTFEKLMEMVPFEPAQKAQTRDEWRGNLLEMLDTIGNARIDAVTVGFYPAPPGVPGNYMAVFRGQFDAAAICAALSKMSPDSDVIEGTPVFFVDSDAAVLVASNHRIVYLGRESDGELGVEEMAEALKYGAGDLGSNVVLANLLKTVDRTAPLWAVAVLTPGMKELPQIGIPLGGFQTATFVATQTLDKDKVVTQGRLVVTAADQNAAQRGVASIEAYLRNAVADGRQQETQWPYLKPLVDLADGVKIEADAARVSVIGTLRDTQVLALMRPTMPNTVPQVLLRRLRPRQ
jgi:hypothetical protein